MLFSVVTPGVSNFTMDRKAEGDPVAEKSQSNSNQVILDNETLKIVEKSDTEWESLNKETDEKEVVIWNQSLTEGTIQNKTTGETATLEVKQDVNGKKTVYENGKEVVSLEIENESMNEFGNNSMLRAYSPWKYIHTYKVNVNAYASAASVGYAIVAVVGGLG